MYRLTGTSYPDRWRAETKSSPSSGVPFWPKASESRSASMLICALGFPLPSKLTISPRCGQRLAHSWPLGAIARSSTRRSLKCAKRRVVVSKVSMPLPDDT